MKLRIVRWAASETRQYRPRVCTNRAPDGVRFCAARLGAPQPTGSSGCWRGLGAQDGMGGLPPQPMGDNPGVGGGWGRKTAWEDCLRSRWETIRVLAGVEGARRNGRITSAADGGPSGVGGEHAARLHFIRCAESGSRSHPAARLPQCVTHALKRSGQSEPRGVAARVRIALMGASR
jgi:hypothetical protein